MKASGNIFVREMTPFFSLKIEVEGKRTVYLFVETCSLHGSCVSVFGFSSIFTPHVNYTVIGMF